MSSYVEFYQVDLQCFWVLVFGEGWVWGSFLDFVVAYCYEDVRFSVGEVSVDLADVYPSFFGDFVDGHVYIAGLVEAFRESFFLG